MNENETSAILCMVFKRNRFRGRKQAHGRKKKALVRCSNLVVLEGTGKEEGALTGHYDICYRGKLF